MSVLNTRTQLWKAQSLRPKYSTSWQGKGSPQQSSWQQCSIVRNAKLATLVKVQILIWVLIFDSTPTFEGEHWVPYPQALTLESAKLSIAPNSRVPAHLQPSKDIYTYYTLMPTDILQLIYTHIANAYKLIHLLIYPYLYIFIHINICLTHLFSFTHIYI